MKTPGDVLKTKTPCCGRTVKVPAANNATEVCDRTCPKCREAWRVVVRPRIPLKRRAGHINVVDWSPLKMDSAPRVV